MLTIQGSGAGEDSRVLNEESFEHQPAPEPMICRVTGHRIRENSIYAGDETAAPPFETSPKCNRSRAFGHIFSYHYAARLRALLSLEAVRMDG